MGNFRDKSISSDKSDLKNLFNLNWYSKVFGNYKIIYWAAFPKLYEPLLWKLLTLLRNLRIATCMPLCSEIIAYMFYFLGKEGQVHVRTWNCKFVNFPPAVWLRFPEVTALCFSGFDLPRNIKLWDCQHIFFGRVTDVKHYLKKLKYVCSSERSPRWKIWYYYFFVFQHWIPTLKF